jgi:hypothetical protein
MPWYADFANYLVADIFPTELTSQQKKSSKQMSSTIFGRSPICSRSKSMVSSDVVSQAKRCPTYFFNATLMLTEDTHHPPRQLQRFFSVVFFGPLFSRMSVHLFLRATNIREWAT